MHGALGVGIWQLYTNAREWTASSMNSWPPTTTR
jgi:hypothetical protein